jgi:hypothetical protein
VHAEILRTLRTIAAASLCAGITIANFAIVVPMRLGRRSREGKIPANVVIASSKVPGRVSAIRIKLAIISCQWIMEDSPMAA